MSSFGSENIHFGIVPYDYIAVQNVGKKYESIQAEIHALQMRLDDYLSLSDRRNNLDLYLNATPYINRFIDDVREYALDTSHGSIDLTLDRSSVLYSYLDNKYGVDFLKCMSETEHLLYSRKGGTTSRMIESFRKIKLLDNRLLYLIVNNKPLRIKLRDFICDIIFKDNKLLFDENNLMKDSYYDYAVAVLKDEFSCTTSNEYGLRGNIVHYLDLENDSNFMNTSRFEIGKVCDSIEFDYYQNGILTHKKLLIQNTNFVAGRRTILRDLLNSVIEFVVSENKNFNYATLALPEVEITSNLKDAYVLKKGENLSCRFIPFDFNNETYYILPHTGNPKSSLKSAYKFLETLGVDKSSIILNFS